VFKTQAYQQDPEQTYQDLAAILKFVTENKYVVEAIFENVLLESQLLNHPFTTFNDSEKKVLMETVLLNSEFKEYIYQKIAKEEIHKMQTDFDEEIGVSETNPFGVTGVEKKREFEDERPTGQIDDDADIVAELEEQRSLGDEEVEEDGVMRRTTEN
jgi:hypothetical protein